MKRTFICQLCNRHFNRKYNLNQHLKRKNPCVKKEEHKNDINTLAQLGSSRLNLVHSSKKLQKGFNCDFCQYSTDKKGNLNRHLKTCKQKKEKEKEEEKEEKETDFIKLKKEIDSLHISLIWHKTMIMQLKENEREKSNKELRFLKRRNENNE